MKRYLLLLSYLLLLAVQPVAAAQSDETAHCPAPGAKADCDSGTAWCRNGEKPCRPEMRGRCGKRRGDWYGASQPVTGVAEARKLLDHFFSGQDYTISGVVEKKWGFKADILDKDGTVVDRVMIDKRSGRIRSIN